MEFNKKSLTIIFCILMAAISGVKYIHEYFVINNYTMLFLFTALLLDYDYFNRIKELKWSDKAIKFENNPFAEMNVKELLKGLKHYLKTDKLKKESLKVVEQLEEGINEVETQLIELNATGQSSGTLNIRAKSKGCEMNLLGKKVKLKSSHDDYSKYTSTTFKIIYQFGDCTSTGEVQSVESVWLREIKNEENVLYEVKTEDLEFQN